MKHHANTHSSLTNKHLVQPNGERLPCRGCTRSCKSYDRCGGKPWRSSWLAAPNTSV